MKQCPKCQKELSEEIAFCPACGEKTVDVSEENAVIPVKESVRYCTKCGTPNNGDAAFCPKCGTSLNSAGNGGALISAKEKEALPNEEHTWKFEYERFSDGGFFPLGAQYTTISAKGTSLSVEQRSRALFFSYGQNFIQFDIMDIKAIVQEKKISFTAVFIILIGLLALMANPLISILAIGLGIWTLKDTFILIQHNRGGVRIKATKGIGDEPEDFLNYVRRYNPDCIRMFVS